MGTQLPLQKPKLNDTPHFDGLDKENKLCCFEESMSTLRKMTACQVQPISLILTASHFGQVWLNTFCELHHYYY